MHGEVLCKYVGRKNEQHCCNFLVILLVSEGQTGRVVGALCLCMVTCDTITFILV